MASDPTPHRSPASAQQAAGDNITAQPAPMGGGAGLNEEKAMSAQRAIQGEIVAQDAQPQSAAIIQVIERAATNPDVDIDKMERLLAMQERIMERDARAAFAAALAEMAPELPVIAERGEIKHGENKPVQSRYALWEDINDAIKPVLARHGFALSFRTGQEAGMVTVTGVLSHRGGHSEQTTMHLPIDSSGSKNGVQGVGSSTSYGKRYTASALLNLTSRGEDDDGVAGGLSGAVEAAKNAIAACSTSADLAAWKDANAKMVGNMTKVDRVAVQAAYLARRDELAGRQ